MIMQLVPLLYYYDVCIVSSEEKLYFLSEK